MLLKFYDLSLRWKLVQEMLRVWMPYMRLGRSALLLLMDCDGPERLSLDYPWYERLAVASVERSVFAL